MVRLTGDDSGVLAAFRDEADAFTSALHGLAAQAWERPTRCTPWHVRDVVGHVITVLARVPEMAAAPAPERPDTTATGYYRADHRFNETANTDRVQTAHNRAATPHVAAIIHDLAHTTHIVITICRQEPTDRVVQTRHGDAMLLTDFLSTRVVELAVHGLDIADAIEQPPWLTNSAAEHLQHLLLGPHWRTAVAELGWDPVTLLRKTTGRAPVPEDESTTLARLGLRRLALG